MLFFGLLISVIITFIRPQDFVTCVKGAPLALMVMVPVSIGWFLRILTIKKYRFVKASQNFLMIAFWITIVLSTLRLNWLTYTFNTSIEWGKHILVYFLLINIINSQKKIRVFIWTIVLCTMVTACLGILQYYGLDLFGVRTNPLGGIKGVGIFDTNQLAYTLAFCLPFVFSLLLLARSIISKSLLAIIFLTYYYAIYLTQSRGGQICSVLVLLIIGLIFSKKKVIWIFGLLISATLFFVLLQKSPRLYTISSYSTDESFLGRVDAWGSGLSTLKNHSFFGIGKGQFAEYFGIAAHNSYIEVATELGLLGLFIWLGLFYFSFKNLRSISNYSKKHREIQQNIISKSLQISLYAYLIGSFLQSGAYYITLYILFALAAVLQQNQSLNNEKRYAFFSFKDLRNIFVLEIAIIALIHFSVITIY